MSHAPRSGLRRGSGVAWCLTFLLAAGCAPTPERVVADWQHYESLAALKKLAEEEVQTRVQLLDASCLYKSDHPELARYETELCRLEKRVGREEAAEYRPLYLLSLAEEVARLQDRRAELGVTRQPGSPQESRLVAILEGLRAQVAPGEESLFCSLARRERSELLISLQDRLDTLLQRYTRDHPRVRSLEARIEALRQ